MIPRSTPPGPPEGVPWLDVSLLHLRSLVEGLLKVRAAMLTPQDRALSESMLSIWYAGPGADAVQARSIDPERELVASPYTSGTYYVRALMTPPSAEGTPSSGPLDGARYYRAEAFVAPPPRPIEVEMVYSRTLDHQVAYNAHLARQNEELLTENQRVRSALHDSEDKQRDQKRQIDQLSAELEAAREQDHPLFGDEIMVQLMEKLTIWLNLPSGGTSQVYLHELFDGIAAFVKVLAADDILLRTIIERQPKAWDAISRLFNSIAEKKLNESRIPPARQMAGFLAETEALRLEHDEFERYRQRKQTRGARSVAGTRAPQQAPRTGPTKSPKRKARAQRQAAVEARPAPAQRKPPSAGRRSTTAHPKGADKRPKGRREGV